MQMPRVHNGENESLGDDMGMQDQPETTPDKPNKIGLGRKILAGALATTSLFFFIAGSNTTTHVSFFYRTSTPHQLTGYTWMGLAIFYCAILAGVTKTKGVGPKVALGCLGSILFAVAFITVVIQSV